MAADTTTETTSRRLLFFNEVTQIVGFDRFQINRMERAGRFPRRRQVSANRVAWLSDEIEDWLNNLPTGFAPSQGARKTREDDEAA